MRMAQKKLFGNLESALFAEPYRVIAIPEWSRKDRVLVPTAVFLRERKASKLLSSRPRSIRSVGNMTDQDTLPELGTGESNNMWEKIRKEIDDAMGYVTKDNDINVDFMEESRAWAGLKVKGMVGQLSGQGSHHGSRYFHCNISNVHKVSADLSWLRQVLKFWKPDPQKFQLSRAFDGNMQLWIVTELVLAEQIKITYHRVDDKHLKVEPGRQLMTEAAAGVDAGISSTSDIVAAYGKEGGALFPIAFRAVIASFNKKTGELVQDSLRESATGEAPTVRSGQWDLNEHNLIDAMVEFADEIKCEYFEVLDEESHLVT